MSAAGNRIALIAIPWFVLETTGDPARAGLSGVAYFVPVVLAGLFGGPLVDRMGFIRSSVLADLASGVTVAAVPVLYMLGHLSFWLLLVLTFAGSMLDVPGTTARRRDRRLTGRHRAAARIHRYSTRDRTARETLLLVIDRAGVRASSRPSSRRS
ncbi:hypothetical protein [Streptomyces sp. NPDC001933]|uniref:hypothetical protein n=1 Tax=Streptomyces sp. NPDC001933 TaxID=3364626 RepID=UPI00368EEC91